MGTRPAVCATKQQLDFRAAAAVFFNVREHLTQKSFYRPPLQKITKEVFAAMAEELGSGYAACFPSEDDYEFETDAKKLEGLFLNTLINVAEAQEKAGTTVNLQRLVETAIEKYCQKLDRYSHYRRATPDAPPIPDGIVGIGARLIELADTYYIAPYPNSPAQNAGLQIGDRLTAIDGKSVEGLSRAALTRLIVGPEGTTVRITTPRGEYTVERKKVAPVDIHTEQSDTRATVVLYTFSAAAVRELTAFLKTLPPDLELLLDFRGNGGGEVELVPPFCSLILPLNTVIGKIQSFSEGESETLLTFRPPVYAPKRIIILQDGGTASSSEMVITAIRSCAAVKVETCGKKTFGKGVLLEEYPITTGLRGEPGVAAGMLQCTTAHLSGPNDETWDKVGIQPTIEE